MARKEKEFHFDFNEDADPVEELHRLRVAMAKHFKTIEAYMEYIRATPTPEEILRQWEAEEREAKPKKPVAARSRKPAAARSKKRPAARRTAAGKHPVAGK